MDLVAEALAQLDEDQIERAFYTVHKKTTLRKRLSEFRKYFDMFDKEKQGFIQASQVGQILRTMGQAFEERDLKKLIKQFDSDGSNSLLNQCLLRS